MIFDVTVAKKYFFEKYFLDSIRRLLLRSCMQMIINEINKKATKKINHAQDKVETCSKKCENKEKIEIHFHPCLPMHEKVSKPYTAEKLRLLF